MNSILPLAQEKKLTVIVRVEPGCLGPDGRDYIAEFCRVAQMEFKLIDADFVNWEIVIRTEKSLPEVQYNLTHKQLTRDQAAKFLQLFNEEISEFEDNMNDKIASLIEHHLGR